MHALSLLEPPPVRARRPPARHELVVYTAKVPARTRAPAGMRWVPIATLDGEAPPNVMRKVVAHGLGD
ncbi:adenine glycosylase MutY [Bradyrhizobium oligotrophicum S58]|uniref:Adenine glycosylase MutY n=1 Tax=Bradyrhizobium oligotrophicum S58 TaxID=1245469 RepID=M4ZYK0_9BRAD|nr:adenine glycosylase MutY [Bradyrhizobium oligotrophicum S58]